MNHIIGIDLGTTNSCVGIYKNNQVEIIINEFGNRTTPSYVAFTDTERLIGEDAKNQADTNPHNTIYGVKRLIGKKYKEIKNIINYFPFKITKDENDNILIEVTYLNETKFFSPEEISAMILSKMKQIAESHLGCAVSHAVVTVPAYFNDAQRQATKDAGAIAGLSIIRIINEPTSAAIAYGYDKHKDGNTLVFDLGGGTLDVSILSIENGFLEVKTTYGDTLLGGEDFDNEILKYCLNEFCSSNKLKIEDIKKIITNPKLKKRLKIECENAKKNLSSVNNTTINVDCFYNDIDLQIKLSKMKFENLCSNYFSKCLDHVNEALKNINFSKNDINNVVLIGGSTRIPKIIELLSNFFSKNISHIINPDEAVAYGASVQAFILSGQTDTFTKDLVLIDVLPFSLGIKTEGDIVTPIIEKNKPLPQYEEKFFSTFSDGQPSVKIEIYEGDRIKAEDNNLLGAFELKNIPPMPKGTAKIKVIFNIDVNGILIVTATEVSSKISNKLVISKNTQRLSIDQINQKYFELEKYNEHDKKIKERINVINSFQKYLDIREFSKVIIPYKQWLNKFRNIADTEEIKNKHNELIKIIESKLKNYLLNK